MGERRSSVDVILEGEQAEVEPQMEKQYFDELDGREHDMWDLFEVHWIFLRNVFPQQMRCQEREDAVTDNYCDQLGPRSLGPPDENGKPMSRLPTSHNGVTLRNSVADYKEKVMPHHILPLWEYVTDSTKDPVSLPTALEKGYQPAGNPSELVGDMMSSMSCDKNFNEKQCLKSRFIKEPRLLTEMELDTPMTDSEWGHWNRSLNALKDYAEHPGDSVDHMKAVAGVPFLDRTRDKYEVLTWQWMRARLQEENEEIAKHAVRLIPNILLQVACSLGIWALGATEIKGGRVEVVIASFTVGIVCVISSIVGMIGVLAENELYLRMFWIAQLWSLSLLTAFLYVELHHVQANNHACSPSTSDLSGGNSKGDCGEDTRMIVASIILCFIEIIFGFMSVYMTTALMDSINDRTSIADGLEVFKYLQFYLNELLRRAGIKESSVSADDYVDRLKGPVRVRNAKGLWATREDICDETETKKEKGEPDEETTME
eukprot:TRINITY_DN7464_c0_g1_i1.p1 TRINITY_DN7464_c0_g1~~TRINITY_DN7464_c0_g1_i1.p1  ORF type:complete len:487 (+),score=154.76 TRINITY_DN7464_c0_g1_i1:63-1523(+)